MIVQITKQTKIIILLIATVTFLVGASYGGYTYWQSRQSVTELQGSVVKEPKPEEVARTDFEGKIIFSREGEIWMITQSGEEKLPGLWGTKVLCSPDGEYLAFSAEPSKLGVLKFGDDKPFFVAEGQTFYNFGWSSDGKNLYYGDEEQGLVEVDVETQETRIVAKQPSGGVKIRSQRAYFASMSEIRYLDIRTGAERLVLGDLVFLDIFDVSPDETKIAYTYQFNTSPIFIYDANTGVTKEYDGPDIDEERSHIDAVRWVPSSEHLLVHVRDFGIQNAGIGSWWLLGLDGWYERICEGCGNLSFSPDSKHFVYEYLYYTDYGGNWCGINPERGGCIFERLGIALHDTTKDQDSFITGVGRNGSIEDRFPTWGPLEKIQPD